MHTFLLLAFFIVSSHLMKRYLGNNRCWAFLMLIFIAYQAYAAIYTPDNLPVPYLQDERRHTCNPDGILDADTQARIDSLLYQLEHQKGVQALAIVVGQMEGEDAFEFGMDFVKTHPLGSKQHKQGLLFLLATEDRTYHILTGDGMEGVLPDAICSRLETKHMLPYLKEGDWNQAMLQVITKTCEYLQGDDTLVKEIEAEDEEDTLIAIIITLVSLGFIGFALWTSYESTKCPRCQQHTLQKQGTIIISKKRGIITRQITYICTHCGHLVTKTEKEDTNNYGSGPIIFGGGGGHGGGGGFSGGSFGGGHFSGGGAGGRF